MHASKSYRSATPVDKARRVPSYDTHVRSREQPRASHESLDNCHVRLDKYRKRRGDYCVTRPSKSSILVPQPGTQLHASTRQTTTLAGSFRKA